MRRVLVGFVVVAAALTAGTAGTPQSVGAAAPVGGALSAIAPTRILDTRTGLGAPSQIAEPGTIITLPIRGHHGVPAGATAVAIQITAAEAVAHFLPTGGL